MNSVKELSQNSAKPILDSCTKIDAREEVAKLSGVSHDTISKVEKILKMASPEEIEKARTGEVSVNQMYSTIKRKEKEEQRDQHVKENSEKVKNGKPMGEIDGLFQTIVIDPPCLKLINIKIIFIYLVVGVRGRELILKSYVTCLENITYQLHLSTNSQTTLILTIM